MNSNVYVHLVFQTLSPHFLLSLSHSIFALSHELCSSSLSTSHKPKLAVHKLSQKSGRSIGAFPLSDRRSTLHNLFPGVIFQPLPKSHVSDCHISKAFRKGLSHWRFALTLIWFEIVGLSNRFVRYLYAGWSILCAARYLIFVLLACLLFYISGYICWSACWG